MTFYIDSQPWGVPATPADPLDIVRRNYPWAQPIEMPRTVFDPLTDGHPYGVYALTDPTRQAR